MGDRKKVHVVPNKDRGGWDVKSAGAKKAASHHETKADAINAGKKQAKNADQGQIIIHKKDGKVQTEHTYANDPHPPRG